MSAQFCRRYIDDYPGIRGECAHWIANGGRCEDCGNRDTRSEVAALRAEVERLRAALYEISHIGPLGVDTYPEVFRRINKIAVSALAQGGSQS